MMIEKFFGETAAIYDSYYNFLLLTTAEIIHSPFLLNSLNFLQEKYIARMLGQKLLIPLEMGEN